MYEEFYHLKSKPFRLSPDPGFFFASRGHKRALAYLRYGLSQDEGFVVITGAPGTGKTTLAQILLKEMDQSHLVVAHLTTSQLEADELLRMVTASFGLRYEGVNKAGMLKTMEAFLMARSREQKRVLLVVDEAQNLPPSALEELRMLSNLQVGDKALVQTFLLGQAQFRAKLDHPDLEQFRQRVIANYHLSELAEDECQSYIETRLHHVGWAGDPSFTPAVYKGIYQYTQGIPRRINMLCDRLLLFGFLEERHQIDQEVFTQVTDELQQEISGRPIIKSNDSYDEVKSMNAALEEQAKSSPSAARSDVVNRKVDINDTVNEVLQRAPEKSSAPVSAQPKANIPNKTTPNVGYNEVVARVQNKEEADADYTEADKDEIDNDLKTDSNKDRFQVITGGRREHDMTVDNVTVPLTPPSNNVGQENTIANVDTPEESDEVVLRKILRLVLAYHRSPRSFPGLGDPSQPLPKGIAQILSLSLADDSTLENFRQISLMGITPAMLRAAVRFFVRRVLFLPGGDDYRVLGLSPGANQDQIEGHYGLLMRLMRQEKRSAEESSINRIGEAYENLCRGVITPASEVSVEGSIADFESSDGNNEDELDLDLAPEVMSNPDRNSRRQGNIDSIGFSLEDRLQKNSDIITSKKHSPFNARNFMLLLGAVVVVAVLYITQMPTATISSDVAVDSAANSQIAQGAASTQTTQKATTDNTASIADATTDQDVGDTSETSTTDDGAEARRQSILANLREKSDEQDKIKQDAEAAKQVKLEEELRQAKLAKVAAEKKARAEAEARAKAEAAKAEAEARAAAHAKAAAEARAREELKARQEAQAQARAAAAAKEAKAAAEARAKALAEARAAQVKLSQASTTNVKIVADTKTDTTQGGAVATPSSTDGSDKPKMEDLNNVVARLERAYTTGNLGEYSKLFSRQVRTNNHTDLAGLREEYKTFFGNTDIRNLALKNLNWQLSYNYALGNGDYEQVIKARDNSAKVLKKGKSTIQIEREDGQLKITRLYFADPESVTDLKVDASPLATKGVLNGMLDKFVKTYEEGKIEPFMSLFSDDARTDDRSNPAGIREDYAGLFTTTSMRKMTLTNMKWAWEDGIAKSTGSFVVDVQAKGKEKINTYKGKLWFEVKLEKGQPKINYFAFETQ